MTKSTQALYDELLILETERRIMGSTDEARKSFLVCEISRRMAEAGPIQIKNGLFVQPKEY